MFLDLYVIYKVYVSRLSYYVKFQKMSNEPHIAFKILYAVFRFYHPYCSNSSAFQTTLLVGLDKPDGHP